MNHLGQNELVDAYYADLPETRREHLQTCSECQNALANLSELLDGVRGIPVPARGEQYGREVWARLQPKLPGRKAHGWSRPWILAPVAAALLVAAFLGGMLTTRIQQPMATQRTRFTNQVENQTGISEADRRRVLLSAISDHLDSSEILLAELLHGTPGKLNLVDERARARDLLEENRLLRETASRSGAQAHAALLDDLERVLLDLANSPAQLSPEEARELRRRVANQGLLFKVRVTSMDTRSQGRT